MKKILTVAVFALLWAGPSLAAQQTIDAIGLTSSAADLRTKVNAQTAKVQANFVDHEGRIVSLAAAKAGKVVWQSTGPADLTVLWVDTDTNTLKAHNGTTWKALGSATDAGLVAGTDYLTPAAIAAAYEPKKGVDDKYLTAAEKSALPNLATKAETVVGNGTAGPYFDGTSDGGSLLSFYAPSGKKTVVQVGSPTVDTLLRWPSSNVSAGKTGLWQQDEYGNITFLDPTTIVGGTGLTSLPTKTGQFLESTGASTYKWSDNDILAVGSSLTDTVVGTTHTLDVKANTFQPVNAKLTTVAGATGNSKYTGTNSSGVFGVYDLPAGGSGGGGFTTLSSAPYSDVGCTTGTIGYFSGYEYLCVGGFYTQKVATTTHTSASPAGSADCMAGTYTFAWDGNNPTGNMYACNGTGTGVAGTALGTPTINTSVGEGSGDVAAAFNAADERVSWPDSGGTLIDLNGTQTVWLRAFIPSGLTGNVQLFNASYDGNNPSIRVELNNDNEMRGFHRIGGDLSGAYSASTVPRGEWVDVAYTWSRTGGSGYVGINGVWGGGASGISSVDGTDLDSIAIGTNYDFADTSKDIIITKVAVVNGLKAAKPW